MNKILIVEDEEAIADLEKDYLELSGFEVEVANDGETGLEKALNEDFNLLILDLMLPGVDGFEICRQVRDSKNTPIIMVSAKKDDIDKIRGLGLGADDYVVKPFSPVELVARVRAHIKIHRILKEDHREEVITAGSLKIFPQSYIAYKHGSPLELTAREFQILLLFVRNPNIAFTRERIFDRIWGLEAVGDMSVVTVYVNKLRDKIEDDPSEPRMIQTVWGVGYRFRG